jgi:hypothetical protein
MRSAQHRLHHGSRHDAASAYFRHRRTVRAGQLVAARAAGRRQRSSSWRLGSRGGLPLSRPHRGHIVAAAATVVRRRRRRPPRRVVHDE